MNILEKAFNVTLFSFCRIQVQPKDLQKIDKHLGTMKSDLPQIVQVFIKKQEIITSDNVV